MISSCIGCGCDDNHCCVGGCSWLRVDEKARLGVCSACRGAHVSRWDEGDRSPTPKIAGRRTWAEAVVAKLRRKARTAIARLRDGMPIAAAEIRSLQSMHAVTYIGGRWWLVTEIVQAFDRRYPQ